MTIPQKGNEKAKLIHNFSLEKEKNERVSIESMRRKKARRTTILRAIIIRVKIITKAIRAIITIIITSASTRNIKTKLYRI